MARNMVDLGVADDTLDDVLDEWRSSDLDLAADAQVVEFGGRIVAYGVVRRPGTLAVVAPEFEGRGRWIWLWACRGPGKFGTPCERMHAGNLTNGEVRSWRHDTCPCASSDSIAT
jgi:hypothetical protein